MKLKVSIRTAEGKSNLDSAKDRFWQTIIESGLRSYDREKLQTAANCENYFRKEFPSELKNKIVRELDSQIRDIERDVSDRDYWRIFEEIRFRKPNIEKYEDTNEYYRTLATAIHENAELKKTLFADNNKYKELIEKRILASQFVFSISNIKYASLGFELNIEPAQKVIDFFDNNFEYLQVFFSSYVADTFNEKFNTDGVVEINYSVTLDNDFKPTSTSNKILPNNSSKPESEKGTSKLDKAKWYWSVVNGSLIFPVIISIYLIYSYSDKLNKLQEIQNQKLNSVFESQDKLINHYQEEIKRLEQLELKLINSVSKKDSTEKK